MTSNEFVAKYINKVWFERIEKWQNRLLQIYFATMTDYNASQVKMVLDEISEIKVRERDLGREVTVIDAKPEEKP